MAVTLVAAGANGDNGSVGSGNPTAPGIPAGMIAGDWMFLPVHSCDNITTSTPSGWTLKQANNAGTALRQTIFWRYWVTGDAAPTIAHAAGDACQARIYGFRGVASVADPIEAFAPQAATGTATVTAPSITSVSDGAAIVGTWAHEVTGNTSGSPTWASYSGTNPTFAEIGDNGVDNLNANELGVGVAWGTMTPGGATGARTAVVTNPALASPTNVIGMLLALTPSSSVVDHSKFNPIPFQAQGRNL